MKNELQFRERTLYWMILSRPHGSNSTWWPLPFIPLKGRPGNRFTTRDRAEKVMAHVAKSSTPVWCPKTNAWVPLAFLLARVSIPKNIHEPIPGERDVPTHNN